MARRRRVKHHRKPVSLGGTNEERNISLVPPFKHEAWHKLFQNNDPPAIAHIITRDWIDPDYYVIAVPRKKKIKRRRSRRWCDMCECTVLQKVPKKRKDK